MDNTALKGTSQCAFNEAVIWNLLGYSHLAEHYLKLCIKLHGEENKP